MSNLISSQKVIKHYLKALLTEDEAAPERKSVELAEKKRTELNQLLAQAVVSEPPSVSKTAKRTEPDTQTKTAGQSEAQLLQQVQAKLLQRDAPLAERVAASTQSDLAANKAYRKGRFQALFFEVAGLKVAVPLTELGGIHQLAQINSLFGKPQWFKGVMLYREQKINVVDTARWIMPEKYDAALAEELNYNYLIMLGTSNWGLSCETLVDTLTLEPDQIKWREQEGKRPWMAGLIKEQMCVLVDVDELINLLNQGLDIHAETNRPKGAVDER